MKFLNLSKSAPKAKAASQQDNSVAIDDKPVPILSAPVSMASFYDEQDKYKPLQEKKGAKTMDISGDEEDEQTPNEMNQEKQPQSWWQALVSWWEGPAPKPAPKKVASLLSETHKDDW